jgi:serine/threonine-protein kinase
LLSQKGPLPEPEIRRIFSDVLKDLEFAHGQAMLHKDITTARVVRQGATWKLADYGLSRIGAVRYMSPERCQGKPLDGRSDIYSLGIVLYEVATGKLPFDEGLNFQIIDAQVNKPPPPPRSIRPELSAELERVILRALTKSPDGRFQNAADFRQAVELVPGRTTAVLPKPGAAPKAHVPGPARPRVGVWVVLAAVVVLGAGFAAIKLVKPGAVLPDFRGLSQEQATADAASRRLAVTVTEVDDSLPKGRVASQSPEPGAKSTGKVELKVSSGLVAVPSVAGLSLAEATRRLSAAGLDVAGVDSQYSDYYAAGLVKSTEPKPDSRLKPHADVVLTVVSGRATCPKCGTKREAGAFFCVRCGHKY